MNVYLQHTLHTYTHRYVYMYIYICIYICIYTYTCMYECIRAAHAARHGAVGMYRKNPCLGLKGVGLRVYGSRVEG